MHPIDRMAELRERPLSVPEALRQVLGYAPSPPTWWRWIHKGVPVASPDAAARPRRAYLWAFKAGRRTLTTVSAVRGFLAQANPPRGPDGAEAEQEQTARRTDDRLRAAGLLDPHS